MMTPLEALDDRVLTAARGIQSPPPAHAAAAFLLLAPDRPMSSHEGLLPLVTDLTSCGLRTCGPTFTRSMAQSPVFVTYVLVIKYTSVSNMDRFLAAYYVNSTYSSLPMTAMRFK